MLLVEPPVSASRVYLCADMRYFKESEIMCNFEAANNKWRVVCEVRTADGGKLLFQVADNGSETAILLKQRGDEHVYCCTLSQISGFINGR